MTNGYTFGCTMLSSRLAKNWSPWSEQAGSSFLFSFISYISKVANTAAGNLPRLFLMTGYWISALSALHSVMVSSWVRRTFIYFPRISCYDLTNFSLEGKFTLFPHQIESTNIVNFGGSWIMYWKWCIFAFTFKILFKQ